MKNFKRQRTHEYRQFKTNHAYQLVGLAKRSQNWLGKLNWTCIKPWLSIKKTFQKSQKYSFSSFWRPFQNTRIGFPRVSDSEFRAASESIFRSQGGHREYGCVIVPQNLQTCRCTNSYACTSLINITCILQLLTNYVRIYIIYLIYYMLVICSALHIHSKQLICRLSATRNVGTHLWR